MHSLAVLPFAPPAHLPSTLDDALRYKFLRDPTTQIDDRLPDPVDSYCNEKADQYHAWDLVRLHRIAKERWRHGG